MTSYERHHATTAGLYLWENWFPRLLRVGACSGTLPALCWVNRLTILDRVTGGMLLLNLIFWLKKIMGIDIRLRVRSAPSPLGPILAGCGILAAIASRMRLVGVPIFSFGLEVFLLSCGLFLSGCSRMRVEPQKSQSLESSGY
jgi:hypothetical protein